MSVATLNVYLVTEFENLLNVWINDSNDVVSKRVSMYEYLGDEAALLVCSFQLFWHDIFSLREFEYVFHSIYDLELVLVG